MAGRPSFHFRVLGPPGCAGVLAGSFWAVGNFLITTAVELGGNAVRDEPSACTLFHSCIRMHSHESLMNWRAQVIMAQSLSATIITSGLLGIFYYGEGGGAGCKTVWFVSGAPANRHIREGIVASRSPALDVPQRFGHWWP